jgi:hypothetical protein
MKLQLYDFIRKSYFHRRKFYFKKIITYINYVIAMASLGYATPIESMLFVSHCPRYPRQAQPWWLPLMFFFDGICPM